MSAPREGGVCSGGVSVPRGVGWWWCLLWGGVCSWGVVSAPVGWCLLPGGWWCLLWGGGVCSLGGCVCSGGWYPSMHCGRTPPPVNRMTERCKNIILVTNATGRKLRRFRFCFCSNINVSYNGSVHTYSIQNSQNSANLAHPRSNFSLFLYMS